MCLLTFHDVDDSYGHFSHLTSPTILLTPFAEWVPNTNRRKNQLITRTADNKPYVYLFDEISYMEFLKRNELDHQYPLTTFNLFLYKIAFDRKDTFNILITAPSLARANLPGYRGRRAQRRDRRQPRPRQDRPCQRDGSQDAALLLLPSLEHRRKPVALSGGLEKGTIGMINQMNCQTNLMEEVLKK